MNQWRSLLIVTLLITCFSGCHLFQKNEVIIEEVISTGQPVDFYLSPHFFRLRPSRIILTIPKSRNNSFEVQTKFADAIHNHLNEKGIFDVILKTGFCEIDMDSIRRGTFDDRELLRISKQFNADGILFCEVNSFSAYDPLQMGCTLTFVDMREAIVTLHTNGFWNTKESNVSRKFLQDVCKIHKCKKFGAEVYLKSPSEFIDFVARDLTSFIQGTVYQALGPQTLPAFNEFGNGYVESYDSSFAGSVDQLPADYR